jgi:hypothetical protein
LYDLHFPSDDGMFTLPGPVAPLLHVAPDGAAGVTISGPHGGAYVNSAGARLVGDFLRTLDDIPTAAAFYSAATLADAYNAGSLPPNALGTALEITDLALDIDAFAETA